MASTAIKSMRWFQFSLRSLFALTALMAVGLTALKFSTHGWAIAMTTITAALLLFAILQAIHGRDSARPFWSGFAVCAGGYLAMLLFLGTSQSGALGRNLPTGEFLDFLFLRFNPEAGQYGGGLDGGGPYPDPFGGPVPDPFGLPPPPQTSEHDITDRLTKDELESLQSRRVFFPRIGHSMFTLLIGWMGGLVAQGIASTRKETQP